MIWRADTTGGCCPDAVREHLRGQLMDQVGGRLSNPTLLDDVAAALAATWRNDLQGIALPPDSLLLMAARTLWRVGEPDAARALTDGVAGEVDASRRLLELVEAGGPTLSACIGLGSRVLRPARMAAAGGGPCWTLDLAGLTTPSGELAELGVPVRVRRILTRTAEIWDRTDGGGVLGIARPPPRAASHLARLIRREIPDLCRLVLERLQADRGWIRCPSVCRLGL
jgi:hypothetical protein